VRPIVARLDGTTAPALLRLLPSVWEQAWDAAFLRETFCWRYLDRPSGGGTWLMFDESDCIAVVDSYLRPYLLDGRRVLVRETADWFCLPKYRPFGLGLKLMRIMMDSPEPMITIGGTDATLSILPRLGWKRVSEVRVMVLPVTLRGFVGNLLRRKAARYTKGARVIPGFVRIRSPRRASPPADDARVEEWRPGQKLHIPAPQRKGLVELLELADLEWICAGPREFSQPMVLVFRLKDQSVGLSLSQLEPSASGPDGRIVHLQISSSEQPVADWIVSETARRLSKAGAGLIRCRASIPQTVTALRKTGFIAARSEAAHWWAKDDTPPPSIIDVGYLRGDDALPFSAARTLRAP
jgi:hypothetical protein